MAERRNRANNLPIMTVECQKVVNTTLNVLTNAIELEDYKDGYVYGEEDSIRCRIYKVHCYDDTTSRVAIFTNEDGSYYAAIEVESEWIEFTILNSAKSTDTIRFNTITHMHFYADDYCLREIGGTPISDMLFGMMSEAQHIGEMRVYEALRLAKEQGLL